MNFLSYNPSFRISFPFTCGIALWLLGYGQAPALAVVCAAYAACLLLQLLMLKKAGSISKVAFTLFTQLFLLLAGWSLCRYHSPNEDPASFVRLLSSEPEFYTGRIADLPSERNKSFKAEVDLQSARVNGHWQNTSGKIIAYFQKSATARNLRAGNEVIFSAPLKEVAAPLNPHEFDYRQYLGRKNIFYTAYVKEGSWSLQAGKGDFSVYGFTQKIRRHLLDIYKQSGLGGTELAMVAALVLGYDDAIDEPLMNAYSHTGTLHVLSVSGLHVGVIYLMLGFLLSFMKGNKKLIWMRVALILLFLWFFVLLSGFSAPAVRAALMFSLILIGKTLFEHVEVTNIVFVAAFISLCYNPYWLADVGFQLSYIAVLGIIYLYPRFYHAFTFSSWLADKVWALCSVSIAAQIATLPLTLYYFHQFPVLFLATNIILIPVSTIVMYGGVMILAFSKITFISKAIVWLTAALIKFMNASALFFDELPFCVIGNIHLSLINMLLMYALIILLFIAIEKRSFRLLAGSLGLAAVMLCISLFYDVAVKENSNLVIYHSDKSSVLSVTRGTFYTELTDTLPDNRLQSTLNENRICNDAQQTQQLHLSNTCLILAGNKKVLYAKDGASLSETLLAAAAPDYIWLPAGGLKRKKQRTALCQSGNLIVSGRFYKTEPCLQKAWFTQNKGAFSVSLP